MNLKKTKILKSSRATEPMANPGGPHKGKIWVIKVLNVIMPQFTKINGLSKNNEKVTGLNSLAIFTQR